MKNLLIPCAGKSTRFPNMRPKWLLTHPDGQLMIAKSMAGLDLGIFDRIIITIVKSHVEEYEADLILRQALASLPDIEICILDDFTSSVGETVARSISLMNIKGGLIIRDSDNFVACPPELLSGNFVVGINVADTLVSNLPGKSFIMLNQDSLITNIVEKRIISSYICLGVYGFEDVSLFETGYDALSQLDLYGEIYISHIISWLITQNGAFFHYAPATAFEDWGTISEWRDIQTRHATIFIDIDGVLFKNSGRYGSINWSNNNSILIDNVNRIIELQARGAQIILTTSRAECFRKDLEEKIASLGIRPYSIIMGLNHSPRILVNDFAPSNPFPSATAISIPRNMDLRNYL